MDNNLESNDKLNLSELDVVSGGTDISFSEGKAIKHYCKKCGKTTNFIAFTGARGRCRVCGSMEYDL